VPSLQEPYVLRMMDVPSWAVSGIVVRTGSDKQPLAIVAGAYVNLIRSIPLILVIFWFYFLVPYIGQWVTGGSQPI